MQTPVNLLQELMLYNQHANQKLIHCFRAHALEEEKIFRLFSHLLNAHHIWLARIAQQPPVYAVWQQHDPMFFEELDTENHQKTMELLQHTPDLEQIIAYKTTTGDAFTNRLGDVLLHIVNHATYHRGQIAMLIRDKGFDPPGTDYILYQRNKK